MKRRSNTYDTNRKTGIGRWLASAALFAATAIAANAQLPVLDGIDWVQDRGNLLFTVTNNGIPLRQGISNFNQTAYTGLGLPDATSLTNNNPWRGAARARWHRFS